MNAAGVIGDGGIRQVVKRATVRSARPRMLKALMVVMMPNTRQ